MNGRRSLSCEAKGQEDSSATRNLTMNYYYLHDEGVSATQLQYSQYRRRTVLLHGSLQSVQYFCAKP